MDVETLEIWFKHSLEGRGKAQRTYNSNSEGKGDTE